MSYKNFEEICTKIYYIMEDLEIYKCLWSDLRRSGNNKRGTKKTERDFFILRDKNNKDDCVHFSLKFIHKDDEILFQNHYSDAVIKFDSYEQLITILNDKCNWNYTLNNIQLAEFCKFLRVKVENKIEAIDEKKCFDFKSQINTTKWKQWENMKKRPTDFNLIEFCDLFDLNYREEKKNYIKTILNN